MNVEDPSALQYRERYLKLCSVDPVFEVDRHGSEFYTPESLFAAEFFEFRRQQEAENALLQELGDTRMFMGWGEFRHVIGQYGFNVIDEYRFQTFDGKESPQHIIAACREKKLLLCAHSYILVEESIQDARVYGARVYGAFDFSDEDKAFSARFRCRLYGYTTIPEGTPFLFAFDAREGMVTRLESLEKDFPFVDWKHPRGYRHTLHLADYGSWQLQDDYDFATKQALDRFKRIAPDWVKEFTAI